MSGAMRLGVSLLGCFAVAGCVTDAGFHCETNEQCSSAVDGMCEATGFCSFGDSSCESGRRYGAESAQLSDMCTNLTDGLDAAADPADGGSGIDGGPGGADARIDGATPELDAGWSVDAGPIIVDFAPSNFSQSLLTAGTNGLSLQSNDASVMIDTDTGDITRLSDMADLHPIGVGYQTISQGTGLPDIGVFTMTHLDIEDGVQLVVVGANALAFAVSGDATIRGLIALRGGSSSVDARGSGGFGGGASSACDGKGAGGGSQGAGTDVGGGGGGHRGEGGAGGSRGSTGGGAGGGATGSASLVPLAGGSGGGCGFGATLMGPGGGGGGALQISARGTIRIGATGVVSVAGGGGDGGRADGGGGGGGAGGAVLFEGGRVVINGGIAANGGGGGAGADQAEQGERGESGLDTATPAAGGAASGEGTSGGIGAAGASAEGAAGGAASPPGTDNAGGGGGAGGRIRLRSDDILRAGTISPAVGVTEAAL